MYSHTLVLLLLSFYGGSSLLIDGNLTQFAADHSSKPAKVKDKSEQGIPGIVQHDYMMRHYRWLTAAKWTLGAASAATAGWDFLAANFKIGKTEKEKLAYAIRMLWKCDNSFMTYVYSQGYIAHWVHKKTGLGQSRCCSWATAIMDKLIAGKKTPADGAVEAALDTASEWLTDAAGDLVGDVSSGGLLLMAKSGVYAALSAAHYQRSTVWSDATWKGHKPGVQMKSPNRVTEYCYDYLDVPEYAPPGDFDHYCTGDLEDTAAEDKKKIGIVQDALEKGNYWLGHLNEVWDSPSKLGEVMTEIAKEEMEEKTDEVVGQVQDAVVEAGLKVAVEAAGGKRPD